MHEGMRPLKNTHCPHCATFQEDPPSKTDATQKIRYVHLEVIDGRAYCPKCGRADIVQIIDSTRETRNG